MNDNTNQENTMTALHDERLPSRDELNISPATAEMLELVDAQDDGDVIARALESAILALVDITGDDSRRPMVSRPGKVARRALARVTEILE